MASNSSNSTGGGSGGSGDDDKDGNIELLVAITALVISVLAFFTAMFQALLRDLARGITELSRSDTLLQDREGSCTSNILEGANHVSYEFRQAEKDNPPVTAM
ncbi:hypothetical protein CkaCkLH20_06813 [Colletotrichum karsti]|uniref:Uncharacterized protein n=1 Tax=Colletotrichum karsti TaxID=1095194 RepID=A0A9P6LK69_9PEZI|nr:uncharacterized protein CkaCkLH20_06813 [Colletotrichum karsti]KAF9875881.1 hypothetical protein CkaCkLH20_06813 [Colletotrichum karsti]